MYSSAFCSVGLQAYNLKSPNHSLEKVYRRTQMCISANGRHIEKSSLQLPFINYYSWLT
jgi:hypothetical protein